MKRILITGAGGFIGSHLVELCVQKGYSVKAFVHYNSRNQWGWLEGNAAAKEIEIVSGDVRDYDSVNRALKGCDTVFHLAALIGIPYSYESPLAYVRTNVEGTYNVLESARVLGVDNVIITSTSETYGTAQYVPINEVHPAVGQSPYSATKIAADQLALSYYYSFGLPVKVVRPFNTYGPRQSARAIIPTIIVQLLNGARVIRLGNLHPKRDLNYVKDTVRGFLAVANSAKFNGQAVNIGSGREISMGELAELIAKLMDVDIKIDCEKKRLRPGKSEVGRLCCDNKKICRYTNWKPQYLLKEGLLETVAWLKDQQHLYKGRVYNV